MNTITVIVSGMGRLASHTTTLRRALTAVALTPADQAAVRLAHAYAAALDDPAPELVKVGPLLAALLGQLGMTPAGRAAVLGKGGQGGSTGPNPLDELRERRARRAAGEHHP
jgi:hypothetical protein